MVSITTSPPRDRPGHRGSFPKDEDVGKLGPVAAGDRQRGSGCPERHWQRGGRGGSGGGAIVWGDDLLWRGEAESIGARMDVGEDGAHEEGQVGCLRAARAQGTEVGACEGDTVSGSGPELGPLGAEDVDVAGLDAARDGEAATGVGTAAVGGSDSTVLGGESGCVWTRSSSRSVAGACGCGPSRYVCERLARGDAEPLLQVHDEEEHSVGDVVSLVDGVGCEKIGEAATAASSGCIVASPQ